MTRKFGIEIEISNLRPLDAQRLISEIGDVPLHTNTNYGHSGYDKWRVTTDASVSSGCEVVSRILEGDEGINELKKVCRALARGGARVNQACGLHVHVEARDLNGNHLRHLVTRYSTFESQIDAFMPRSRRGNSNHFCGSVANQIQYFSNHGRHDRNWNSNQASLVAQAYGSRYMKVNLQSWIRQRTVEFRQHSGSVNASKIANWVKFVLQFTEESVRRTPQVENVEANNAPVQDRSAGYSQTNYSYNVTYSHRRILNILIENQNQCVTISQLASRARLSETSIPSYISTLRGAYGLTIRNNRRRRFGAQGYTLVTGAAQPTPAPTPAPVPVVSTPDSLWSGIDPDIESFYNERAMELA